MKIFKSLIVCLSLVLVSQGAAAQDTKIGVLNALQALFNSDAARVVQEELEQEFSTDEERAQELTEQLTALREEFNQNEAVMSEQEISRMNSNAQDLQVQYATDTRKSSNIIAGKESAVSRKYARRSCRGSYRCGRRGRLRFDSQFG